MQEHLHNLEAVFRRLSDNGLRVNLQKCDFMKTEVEYLGHIVSSKGLRPAESKVEAIKNLPRPTNLKELQSFMAYISIYIAVSFTIERFIAIRYPLKRQTFCTESLAKRVIAGVTVFCLLSTISTAFEHKAGSIQKLMDIDGTWCDGVKISNPVLPLQDNKEIEENIPNKQPQLKNKFAAAHILGQTWQNNSSIPDVNNLIHRRCYNVTFYQNGPSRLGENVTYTKYFFILTSVIFVFIPLGILATFNFILIVLVRKSKHRRGEMTNASVRQLSMRKRSNNVSQENRITVTLIAVVILFIICQLPWAIYLIVAELIEIEINLKTIIGNIFNLLAAMNAASNFFLYCVLSDKYRKTVKELIVGYKYRRRRFSTSCVRSTRRYRITPQIN